MMKIIAKIESNHAKILEFERRRFERRIRKLTLQLDEDRQKMNNFSERISEWSEAGEVGPMGVREAQYRVAVIADSDYGELRIIYIQTKKIIYSLRIT